MEPRTRRRRRVRGRGSRKVEAMRARGDDPYPGPLRPHAHARRGARALGRQGRRPARRPTTSCASPAGSCCGATRASSCSRRCATAPATLQLFVSKGELGDDAFARFVDEVERGDWVGVEGTVMKTKKGELSVNVDDVRAARRSRCARCPRSGTASPTPTRATASATSTSSPTTRRAACSTIRFAAVAAMRRVPRRARVRRGRDAGAAPDPRRRDRAAVRRRTTTRSTPTSPCASRPSST